LLLLVGIIHAKPKMPRLAWWAGLGALALALVAPAKPVALPWEWLSALLIPILFWQAARRLVQAQKPIEFREIFIWFGMALGIGGIILLISQQTGTGPVLFGLLAASMAWQAVEQEEQPSYLGQLGPLALAFLLAEIAPAIEAPGRYLIALLAGAGIGALTGYSAFIIAQKIPKPEWLALFSLGQVYLGYGIAVFFDLSGVAAALMCVAVYVASGTRHGLWPDGSIRPRPLDSMPVFIFAVLVLAFFAWQTHVPITPVLLLEIGLGILFTLLVIWFARRLGIAPFLVESSYPRIVLRVGLLLVPAVMLWPREALLDPIPLAIALLIAALVMAGTHYTLTPILNIYSWLEEANVEVEDPDQLVNTLLVHNLMVREFATIPTTETVPDIARLFDEQRLDCLPVLDANGQLAGIVTEHDLFIKEKKLPRTDLTYQAVFDEPVTADELPAVYAQRGSMYTAADVMTQRVIWVRETSSIGQAVRLMVQYGFKCLPVLDAAPQAGGKLVGIITRSSIVSLLVETDSPSRPPMVK
jgi:CBS domain-containing protein